MPTPAPALPSLPAAQDLDSLFELMVGGGPLMVPIGLCSVVALAFAVERWVRLRPALLGSRRFARDLLATLRRDGLAAAAAEARARQHPLARLSALALSRADEPFLEREKALEDLAASEFRRLGANLRPLLLVWLIAPLLGLLGTVWGMIEAFGEIANAGGLGRPELLASGIYQALTTTAAGLAVSIPAVVAHHWLKGRIEAFARRCEAHLRELDAVLRERGPRSAEPLAAQAPGEGARERSPAPVGAGA
jgi:biopolymer transport protein ExbB